MLICWHEKCVSLKYRPLLRQHMYMYTQPHLYFLVSNGKSSFYIDFKKWIQYIHYVYHQMLLQRSFSACWKSLYNCPTHHKNPNHCRSMINISTEQLFKICTGFPKDIFTILMDENVLRTNITETGTLMYERKSTSSKINDESTWYNVQINHTVSFPMTSVPHRMRYQCCKLYLGQVKICAR